MGTRYRGIALQVFGALGTAFPLFKMRAGRTQTPLLMKSPIFFSKGRTVRFWIQIVLVLALLRIAFVPSALYANPSGEQVVGGMAGFNRPDAATLIVNQNTDRAVINWNSFSIANGELTRFVQPSSSSAVLNRVVTANPSSIYGTLQANGNVYLINPGGVLVGAGGVVNTASFVASTHDMNTEEFMKGGQLNFQGNSDASVINQGNITAREGDVFLIAKEVKNEGQLMAKDGTVGMVSGTEVSLQAVGQGNFKVRLMAAEDSGGGSPSRKASESSAEIVNEGVIQAANAVLEAKGSYLPMAIKNTGVIEATGLVKNGDGSVSLIGGEGDLLNTGVVAALQRSLDGQKETGGSIMMTAKNVTSDLGSVITASGRDGGGSVKLQAVETTILRGEISVVGASESAKGGKVQLLGEKVGMFDSGKVDVSGGAGGGEVLAGGDYLGKNLEVPNAKAVVMAPTTEIRADAKTIGDGGKVILWSDDYTGFFGEVTALGGAQGGNGGFVETSSAGNLQAMGKVNASAPNGLAGNWLLDPGNITIAAAPSTTTPNGFSGGNPLVFTAPVTSSTVLNTDISDALNLGTSVTIQTGTGAEYGITVSAAISKTLDNATTLTLDATGAITISADITSISNELNMVFRADSNANNAGDFILSAGADLFSNGGNITVTAADVTLTGTMNTLKTIQIPVAVTTAGSYAAGVVPTVTIAAPASTGGIAATATALMGLNTVAVGTGGTGYSSAPKVVIERATGDTTGVGATANAIVAGGVVTGITITNPGSGYTATPTFTFVGGGGAGATAGAVLTKVVNLAFDGAGAEVSSPSYGVGYASNEVLTTAGGGVIFSAGIVTAAATLGGVANVAGNVVLQPSTSTRQLFVGTAGGVPTFSVTDAEISNITIGAVPATGFPNGLITAGTIAIGNRSAGALTVEGLGGLAANQTKNISLISGGAIQDGGGVSVGGTLTTGLLSMETATTIGSVANPLNLDVRNVSVKLDGNILQLDNIGDYELLHVSTAGITGSGIGGANDVEGANIDYGVSESTSGNTTITFFLVSSARSVDFLYENRSSLTGGGGITVDGDVRNVQAAADGVPDTFRDLQLRAPKGTITVSSGISINSGGGNMTLASEDLVLDTEIPVDNSDFYDSADAGVLNTFQSTGSGGTFGIRVPGSLTDNVGSAGQISGTGGVLTLEPLSDSGAGRLVSIGVENEGSYVLTLTETMLLEAPAIRIGGDQAGDISIAAIDELREPEYIRGGNETIVSYTPRYFENPFFNAESIYGPDNSGSPIIEAQAVPHVEGGTVSFVSARGEVRNVPDGDVNVYGLSMTGVDGAYFDGRGGVNNDYAVTSTAGSVISEISGRTGRTIMDETIGNGGDFSFYVGQNYGVVNGRTVSGAGSTLTSSSGAAATTTVAGGQLASIASTANGYQYSYNPVVTIYGGGIQEASARALVTSSGTVGRVVPQIVGTGYKSVPVVSFSGGGGSGAVATAFVNAAGQLSPIDVISTATYSSVPTIQIFGDGTRVAVARPILSNGTSGTLTGIQIVDPGEGYTTVSAIVLSGGGQTTAGQAQVALAAGYNPSLRGGQITPIYLNSEGTDYTSEPTVTLSGGGIAVAQAKAIVDTNPGSSTRGQVVGYQITDPGQGYTSAPSVIVGQGQAFGNFGEYGVSTEQVDQNRPSGNIVLDSISEVSLKIGSIDILAPVRTGNAFGVGGTSATSGSVLISTGFLTTNTDTGSDGVIITGDANVVGSTGGLETATSGSITITAYNIANDARSRLSTLSGSKGLPVQIGTASGAGGGNGVGSLSADVTDRISGRFGAGDLRIYAPAPGELETAAGQPIDPNHVQQAPRSSNDLYLSLLQSDFTKEDASGEITPDESLVTVEVGALEGQLTLQRYAPSSATATIGTTLSGQSNGQVTLITPILGGALYSQAPAVVISGGGIVQAEAGVTSISGGQLSAIVVENAGSGYGDPPLVTITGGGGTGATAEATVANGVVTGITITSKGFGYTSLPTVTLGQPAGTKATATATSGLVTTGGASFVGGITSITVNDSGTGYFTAPVVTITDSAGFGRGASATAIIDGAGKVTGFTINSSGIFYIEPVVTLTDPSGTAVATANLTNGKITSYTITSPGAGYKSSPTVYLQGSADPYNLDVDKLLLAADRFSILSGAPTSLVVTAATAVVAPFTNQRPVNLGAVETGSTSFTSTDLQRFAVNDLVLGRRQEDQSTVGAGVITISQALAASSLKIANGIGLAGTREIQDAGGSTGLSFTSVVLDAGAQVSLTGTGNQIQYLAGIIRDSGMAENATFTLSSSLVSSGTNKLPLTIGEVFLDGAFGTGQRFYQGITTQNGDIRVFADQIQQTRVVGFLDSTGGGVYGSGGIGANTAQVTLAPLTSGTGIDLYATAPSSSSVLGLRVGNPQALGLELVGAKGLVIGSGSLRDIQITDGGFGYQAPPSVTITSGGGSGAEAVAILSDTGYLVNGVTYYQVAGVRITNPGTGYTSALTTDDIIFSPPAFGASIAKATATIGAAGAITLNSNLEFNYLDYPNAPYQVTLASGSTGSITAQKINSDLGAIASNYYRVRVGALNLFDAGAVTLPGLNDVDSLSAVLTGSGTASNLSFEDTDGIQLGRIDIPGTLTIRAGTTTAGQISQTAEGIEVGGTSSFTTSRNTGGQAINLANSSNNNFVGAVTLINAGAFDVAISDQNALTLETIAIPAGNFRVVSTGALNLGAGTVGGNLTATSNGGAITQAGALTVSGTGLSAITAGAAAITLANVANNFGGTVALSNSGTANGITLNDATASLTIGNITSAGAVAITASGGGILTFGGAYADMRGSLTATAKTEETSTATALTISSAMLNITSATLLTDGTFTLGAGANLGNTPGAPSTTTTTSISLTADSLGALNASLTAQAIVLQPYTSTLSLGLNNAAATYDVPVSILAGGTQKIFAQNTLTLGSTAGTGGITIGNSGAVDLSVAPNAYSLVLRGLSGGVTFANTLTLPNNTTFDLSVGTSSVTGGTGTDLVIGGAGTVSFGSANSVSSFQADVANIGTSVLSGSLDYTSVYVGNLTVGQMSVAGASSFTLPATKSFTAANAANAFTGTVTLAGSGGNIENVTINNSKALTLGNLTIDGDFSSTVTNGALTLGTTVVGNAVGDDFTATGVGIRGGPLTVTGATSLTGGTGDVTLTGANNFGTAVTVVSSKNTSLFVRALDDQDLGAVTASGTFTLTTTSGENITFPSAAVAGFNLTTTQLANFNVRTFAPTATSANILIPTAFSFANIPNLSLNTINSGNVTAEGAITAGTLTISSGGSATLDALNSISNLGNVTTLGGNFSFINGRQLNLVGSVSVVGNAAVTVAGQFYNNSGRALPFAGTTGRAVVRSLSMMGGLPNQISALAGFKNSYNFTDPGSSRAMIYAVSPLAQFAPSGTTIAGVDLSGTQTGGGQFNTFLTGSDNLNWIISDFGRFEMPVVKPSGMDYILYPQRVEPETRTLPAATLGQLEKELGRPPTLDEIQAREVAVREAGIVRSGAILERTSFDAVEDEVDKQESAEVPAQVIDGGKPQAGGPSVAPSPLSGGAVEGFGPQAKVNIEGVDPKTTDNSGRLTPKFRGLTPKPMLRSGPKSSVATLRPSEPSQNTNSSELSAQALNLDAKSVMEQERASAEVGIAPPIAGR